MIYSEMFWEEKRKHGLMSSWMSSSKNMEAPQGVTGARTVLLAELTSRLVSRALSGELDHHLGYGARETPPPEQDNRRNRGQVNKTVSSRHGQFPIEVPRDREGSFEPKLVGKPPTTL